MCVLSVGHQGLSRTSVCSCGAQCSGQREIQQAEAQNSGQASATHPHGAASDRGFFFLLNIGSVSCDAMMLLFFCFFQDLEQMAKEQDKESDRVAIQTETESQWKQMLRCLDTDAHRHI